MELGYDKRAAVGAVETDRQVTRQFHVLVLVAANRDPVGAVKQDVGGHEARVGEQRTPGHRLAPSLFLVLHHAGELADVRSALQQVGQLGVGGHGRLDEHRLLRQASSSSAVSRVSAASRPGSCRVVMACRSATK